jgi:inhibitor of KinA
VPTLYGGEYGPDIEFVATHNNITPEEVIEIHTATPYLVYMLGFTAGFPYLGGMSEKIATPRLKTPRTRIPAGSVGIAASQTGLYPIESPGGWQLIGRTPIKAFSPQSENPFLFAAGDYLKFRAIEQDEYDKIKELSEKGEYVAETSIMETAGEAK